MLNALWQKYNSIPRMGRIWIAATTGVVAYFGGEMVDRMYDDYVIREEAERRVKQEAILERQRRQAQASQSQDSK